MLDPKHLQYFKDLIEGKDVPSWDKWWKDNEAELATNLTRMQFLNLKFSKFELAEKLLQEAGISYSWTPKGK